MFWFSINSLSLSFFKGSENIFIYNIKKKSRACVNKILFHILIIIHCVGHAFVLNCICIHNNTQQI